MEDDDGFVRTLPDSPALQDSDDDSSILEFGEQDDNHNQSTTNTMFVQQKPSSWNLSNARKDAQQLRPFQTTIDEKIRSKLVKIPESKVEVENDEEENDSTENGYIEKQNGKTNEKISKDDELSDDSNDEQEEDQQTKPIPMKKGKKRQRKEKNLPKSFNELNLSKPLQKAIDVLEWTEPTPIQGRAVPCIIAGRDICASAVTGSGKTGAFVLPILERLLQSGIDNVTRVIILLPTRELAAQCHAVITTLAKYTSIRSALVVGGLSNKNQEVALRMRPHIIVATPGRLIDHIRNAQSFSLEDVEILVMDEADRLLEMGFKAEVEEIVRNTPVSQRQTLLFSATITPGLQGLMKISLQNPINLAVDPMFDVAGSLSQEFIKLRRTAENNKDATLFALATRTFKSRVIVFFRQKIVAHRFKILFGLNKLRAAELHGNLTQEQRLTALDHFREGAVDFLLCTDLASRGLDISGVETVINYDMPGELKEYIHRVGRTARAGKSGRACSLVCTDNNDERKLLKNIAKHAQSQLQARAISPSVIGKWRAWIDSVEPVVKSVLKEERHEKELRLAEMELKKADNLLKHSNNIYARPAKTWFQSSQEKLDEKQKAREEKGLLSKEDKDSRASKRKLKAIESEKQKRRKHNEERQQGFTKQRMEAKKRKKNVSKR